MGELSDWVQLEELGRGGQGIVFKVVRSPADQEIFTTSIRNAINDARETTSDGRQEMDGAAKLIGVIREELVKPFRVLKKLHAPADARDPLNAKTRMSREIRTMQSISHPALLRIVDTPGEDGLWYVAEYHEGGTLDDIRNLFIGNILETLRQIRPLVDGVAKLHEQGIVHRDIKPENIFVSNSGQLVLGDFGLAIPIVDDGIERVTDTYENVGTWDWMPTWAQGKRVDELSPTFDVFALGKVIWWMISGKRVFQFWYFDRQGNCLEEIFDDCPEMKLVNDLLAKCVVENEPDCTISNGGELGHAIDELTLAIGSSQLLNSIEISKLWKVCSHCSGNGIEPGGQPGNWELCRECGGSRGEASTAGQAIAQLIDNVRISQSTPSM